MKAPGSRPTTVKKRQNFVHFFFVLWIRDCFQFLDSHTSGHRPIRAESALNDDFTRQVVEGTLLCEPSLILASLLRNTGTSSNTMTPVHRNNRNRTNGTLTNTTPNLLGRRLHASKLSRGIHCCECSLVASARCWSLTRSSANDPCTAACVQC